MPLLAAGTITLAIVRHLLAPNAREASRNARGTSCKNCSVLRAEIGMSIRLSAIPPARAEKPCMGTTTMPHTKTPITIEGTPFSRSAV